MSYHCKTPEDVLKAIKHDKIAMVDLRFTDLPELWAALQRAAECSPRTWSRLI